MTTSTTQKADASAFGAIRHRKVPAETLYVSKPTSWLESRFHFSFADHWDPKRMNFGVLRVVNDDLVAPSSGFGTHPHNNQEIFSYIVDGELTHRDSHGNQETLGRGCVQYMSAGTGVSHSEMNQNKSQTCRFLQIWVTPERRGLPVQYGSAKFTKADRHNKLNHMITGTQNQGFAGPATIRLQQDCNVYVSELDKGQSVELPLEAGRQAYMVCIEGTMDVTGGTSPLHLSARDAAELYGSDQGQLNFTATSDAAHFLLLEMAQP